MDKITIKDKMYSVYSGRVHIEEKVGNTVISTYDINNSGTLDLFKFILNCVRGSNEYNKRPGYIHLLNNTAVINNAGVLYDSVTAPINVNSEEEYYSYITYTFMIPGSLVAGKTINKAELRSINSVYHNENTEYASVSFDDITISDISTNVEINWTLKIGNPIKGDK